MNIYKFRTTFNQAGETRPWETTVVAQNEVHAITAAAIWVKRLSDTVNGPGTFAETWVENGEVVLKVEVEYADHAIAEVVNGRMQLKHHPKGGLCIAKVNVPLQGDGINLSYLRYGVDPVEVMNA